MQFPTDKLRCTSQELKTPIHIELPQMITVTSVFCWKALQKDQCEDQHHPRHTHPGIRHSRPLLLAAFLKLRLGNLLDLGEALVATWHWHLLHVVLHVLLCWELSSITSQKVRCRLRCFPVLANAEEDQRVTRALKCLHCVRAATIEELWPLGNINDFRGKLEQAIHLRARDLMPVILPTLQSTTGELADRHAHGRPVVVLVSVNARRVSIVQRDGCTRKGLGIFFRSVVSKPLLQQVEDIWESLGDAIDHIAAVTASNQT
mmetsp:Transcript_123237/g.224038  ORF Transcript_123237/g.224038 Transcript_123237/m.224038 type:complete len:261 (+) Transcript_123237:33-815(+)